MDFYAFAHPIDEARGIMYSGCTCVCVCACVRACMHARVEALPSTQVLFEIAYIYVKSNIKSIVCIEKLCTSNDYYCVQFEDVIMGTYCAFSFAVIYFTMLLVLTFCCFIDIVFWNYSR